MPAVILGLVLVAVSSVACAARPSRAFALWQRSAIVLPSDSDGTYQVPTPLPPGQRGDLITSIDQGRDSRLGAAHRITLLYHSVNSRGQDVAVSGVLLVPEGRPGTNWPLISWAHGTVGIADPCAPSHVANLGFDFWADHLRAFLEAGFAVAATDYIGLGTPGDHTYMSAVDQGNAVADIVPAVRRLNPYLSETWFAVGHSQGGAAVLSTTRAGANGSLPAGLAATVAIAPGNSVENVPKTVIDGTDTDPYAPLLDMYVLIGAAAADPAVRIESVLSTEGRQAVEVLKRDKCLVDYFAENSHKPGANAFIDNSRALADLVPRLRAYGNPDNQPTNGPVLVVTGDADTVVPTPGTLSLIEHLRQQGSHIDALILKGQDHIQPLANSLCRQLEYLTQHGAPSFSPRTHAKCP
ncbi:alpha/beta hydrolase family protein [Mycobacterium montefiorense]|uniref:alpha/beta hydrolase family protein n=1 Tax=Mycobacterium montefiorense TaxID=154654 RepID=UPI0022322B34|nr:alpha/beta hydrolase [Mycobacterium montefiorense]